MTRFLVDAMLGTLARYLRMAGHDAAYGPDRDAEADDDVLALAAAEDRTVLTRDADLAARADAAVLLTERAVVDQVGELRAAGVAVALTEPARCGTCNGPLEPMPGDADTPGYAPDPADVDCWRCRDCGQVFWRGSHWDRVADAIGE